jgi:hypothetical protein|tara:strand:+ start:361 stop:570 length:210 start_codon:yes stop_codon:yes gene_type:complete
MEKPIDLTPAWTGVAQIIALGFEHGNEEGRALAREELFHMGRLLDRVKARENQLRKLSDEISIEDERRE